jgi:NADPH2:quinone reductase
MNAILCNQFGPPNTLVYTATENPTPQPDEVLIRIKACSANFPDVLIIQNKYQFKPSLPFSPGGEVAGDIIGCGANVHHLKMGDRVIALCGWGGFAEQVAVKAARAFVMPSPIDYTTAASTLYTHGTSYHALSDRANLKAGETLLVLGAAGGVGLAAVELGKLLGAKVIAAASSASKLKVCKEKGADEVIDYSQEDVKARIKELTGEKGVDVVYDPIGGHLAEQALRAMAWKGRYLVVGFASGTIPQFAANLALLKGCSIVGVFWGSFSEREPDKNNSNIQQLLKWIAEGKIKQHIYKEYPLQQAPQALQDMADRKVIGKAVIVI